MDILVFGLFNVRSAVNKNALIHDMIFHNNLSCLALTETWISADAPNAIKLQSAPVGYLIKHTHRNSKVKKTGEAWLLFIVTL